MADAALSIGQKAAAAAAKEAGKRYLEQSRDQYNEDDVKEAILTELQRVKDDTEALRNADFRSARRFLDLWRKSNEPIDCEVNAKRLDSASDCAVKAFNTVASPLDRLEALSFLIFADYHRTAFSSRLQDDGPPNWTAGKKEVQNILRSYFGEKMKDLADAAKDELGLTRRRFFRNKEKRREMLLSFVNLSAAVFALRPHAENVDHPRFAQLEEAALRAHGKDRQFKISARICHLIKEPVEGVTLEGHTYAVRCCAVFADGTRAISGSNDRTLKVWDLTTGEAVRTLEGHTGSVECCAVFADGTRAASGSLDHTLKVWDLATGKAVRTLEGHTSGVRCCAVFADGTRAISGSIDESLKVWDLTTSEAVRTLEGHTSGVWCCAVFADGTRAVSGSGDNTLKVWDITTGEVVRTLEGHTDGVLCCAIFADGTTAVSGSGDRTLKVWDLATGEAVRTLEGHTADVSCCAVFADGTRAVSGSEDHTIKVWDFPYPSCQESVALPAIDTE